MKKRNLIILLLMPFIISLFGLTAINMTFNLFDNDIIDISWEYDDVEGFKIDDDVKYQLKARAISDANYPSKATALKWTLKNNDESNNEYASIEEENGKWYLSAISEGEVIITCSNEKGNVFRSMTGIIYQNGYVAINPVISGSQNNVSEKLYYGQYDLDNNEKVNASIEYNISAFPSTLINTIDVSDYSYGLIDYSIDKANKLLKININNPGDAYLTLESSSDVKTYTYEFAIVKNGINVYNYDDLLYCTNKSENGEIVVLRKSFDSVSNTYKTNSNGDVILSSGKPILKQNNTELFGHCIFDKNGKYSFDFENEIYTFEATYNHEYIDKWNEFANENSKLDYSTVSSNINVGIHVQKDFYGNGYTLNLHNLTYPYSKSIVDGNIIPKLTSSNLFRGPLPFYTLGNPNGTPLVSVYGQDNIGMYVDGNNITVNDVVLRNCDFGNNFANLDYVGTVIETNGDNITIENSRFSNGKNVLRSFSSKTSPTNVLVNNCIFSYARNFLIITGSNDYIPVNDDKINNYIDSDGKSISDSNVNYLSTKGEGDNILNSFFLGNLDSSIIKEGAEHIQYGLDDTSVGDIYTGEMTINDCYFYKSGIASIALESAFNGPYLYSNSPSLIGSLFSLLSVESKPLIPYEASNISGTSYPVKVNLSGKTKFYDYKETTNIDISGLILENISVFAKTAIGDLGIDADINRKISIDDIFPIKNTLMSNAGEYLTGNYINIPVAYYGGGLNLSKVDTSLLENDISSTIEADLFESLLKLPSSSSTLTQMKYMMQKCVTVVTGFHPFKFSLIKGSVEDVDLAPSVELLKLNAKGGS